MDGVKVALGNRGITEEAARQCGKDRKEWRALVYNVTVWVSRRHFWLALCSYGPPSRALVVITWRGAGFPLHDAVEINCKKGATTEYLGADVKYMG